MVSLYVEFASLDVVGKFLAGPSDSQGLFLNLSVTLFSLRHRPRRISIRLPVTFAPLEENCPKAI